MTLFNTYFYHQTTKTFITVFGSLFKNLHIVKRGANGEELSNDIVPIDFAPKNKWMTSIKQRPDFETQQVQMTLPRMAFDIVAYTPNMSRKMGFNGTYTLGDFTAGGRTKIFNPTPIDLSVELYAVTKDNEDMLQILEQILPYFQPFITVNFPLLPEFGIKKDVQIALESVTRSDNYEGAPDDVRMVEYTFRFNAPLYFFGPIADKGNVIKDVKVGLSTDTGKAENFEVTVNPVTANKGDAHTLIQTWK